MTTFSDMQLDALRELANIGSGNAGTALGAMLGKSVDIYVPTAAALPLDEAVAIAGAPDELRYGVVVPIVGDFDAIVVLLFPEDDAKQADAASTASSPPRRTATRCSARSATSSAPTTSTRSPRWSAWRWSPQPPQVVEDMLASILSTVLIGRGDDVDEALILDSNLLVEEEECTLSFLLLPNHGGIKELLGRLGL